MAPCEKIALEENMTQSQGRLRDNDLEGPKREFQPLERPPRYTAQFFQANVGRNLKILIRFNSSWIK
jgi:hypothetical protein